MPSLYADDASSGKTSYSVSEVSAMTADQVRRILREKYGWSDMQLQGKGKMELNELLLDGREPPPQKPVAPPAAQPPVYAPPPPARRYKINTEADYRAGGGLRKGDKCVVMFRENGKYITDPMATFMHEERDLFRRFIGLVFELSVVTGKPRLVTIAWRDFIDAWKT